MKKKVLIVDDDANFRYAIRELVPWKKGDFEIIGEAIHGKQALDILRKTPCDIVLTDMEMPLMDGHRLCKLVKEDPTMKQIPVVIFSSLINEQIRRKGESLGADAQLTKPEIGSLVAAVDELVDKYEMTSH